MFQCTQTWVTKSVNIQFLVLAPSILSGDKSLCSTSGIPFPQADQCFAYSEFVCTSLWLPCPWRNQVSLRSLPTRAILWFCDISLWTRGLLCIHGETYGCSKSCPLCHEKANTAYPVGTLREALKVRTKEKTSFINCFWDGSYKNTIKHWRPPRDYSGISTAIAGRIKFT